MNEDTRLADKINEQLNSFVNIISKGLSKPKRKFISQMLFGMQVARDIKLSEVARSLEEEIKLIKTENRLSRNINDNRLWQHINSVVMEQAKHRIEKDTIIALDLSSIEKFYAHKMEFLSRVWDGMDKKTVNGYWLLEAIAADVYKDWVVPLYAELYSQDAYDFESENKLILKVMHAIHKKTNGKGIWAIDRGADRKELINPMLFEDMRFVIRINLHRLIKIKGKRHWVSIKEAALRFIDCPHTYEMEIDNQGCKEKKQVSLGMATGWIKGVEQKLTFVIVKGFGKDPLILLTNVNKNPVMILEMYLTRWKIEESFRFLKQEYRLEDIRVRRYPALKNTFALLSAVFYFLSVYLGRRLKLDVLLKKICEKAKRFFQIPTFNQYAIADGIHRILFGSKWSNPWERKKSSRNTPQFLLSFMRA